MVLPKSDPKVSIKKRTAKETGRKLHDACKAAPQCPFSYSSACFTSTSPPVPLPLLSVSHSIKNIIIFISLLYHNHKNKVIIRL